MDISSVNSDLIRGNVTTIILGCLLKSDRYGYEILKEIEDRSTGQYTLKQATLYNQLKRLEKQGLVSSYDGDPDDTGGGQRRYYTLTESGKQYLVKERSEYEYSRTILDKLVSEKEFDFTKPLPFDASELRPYTKREGGEKPSVVYKDKVVEKIVEVPVQVEKVVEVPVQVEKVVEVPVERLVPQVVEVEKTVYLDRFGNPVSSREAAMLASSSYDRKVEVEKPIYLDRRGNPISKEEAAALALKADEDDMRSAETQKALDEAKQELLSKPEELDAAKQEALSAQRSLDEIREELEALKTEYQNECDELERYVEQTRMTEELLASVREDKDATEEQLDDLREKLRVSEEERLAAQDALRAIDEEKQRLEEEERVRAAEEEERRREEQLRPSHTLEELFAKLEAESEYSRPDEAPAEQPARKEQPSPEPEYQYEYQYGSYSRPTLDEIFKRMDERSKMIDSQKQQEEQVAATVQEAPVEEAPLEQPVATINRRQDAFEYEKEDVNYREFFYSISEPSESRRNESREPAAQDGDIRSRLYAKGYTVRPYDRGNTSEYYTFSFIQSNRINRDTFLIVLGVFLFEMAIAWVSLYKRVSYAYFLPIILVGTALCLIPTVMYLLNPTKRIRANFSFKLSILNRSMLFIELTVVCILIGFFALGASINDIDLIICSIIIPAIILFNLPLSSIFYWLLYRTHKYHIA